jgi:sugar porter (SP) family MFS transporter
VIVTDDFLDVLDLDGKTSMISTVTALYDVGCFFGAIASMVWGERFGRKKSILWGTTSMSIGAILQITAYGVPQMIVGRIVAGIGNGINTATAPVWQGETSQVKWRGKLVVIELIMCIAGYSLSTWMTFAFSFLNGPVAWRFPLTFQFVFIFVIFGTVPWLPESPRWLISHDRLEEAQTIVADIEGLDINDPYVITQHTSITTAVQYERNHSVRWSHLLCGQTGDQRGTGAIRRLVLGAGAQAIQQLAGINVTSYYLTSVLIDSVGLSNRLARLLTACNSISYLLAGTFAIPNIERWGRRQLLMICSFGQGVCYILITVLIRFTEKDGYAHQKEVASASVAFFFCYYLFFGCGFQGIPWLLPVELNSLSMRTKGVAIATATNWAFNFMVVEITPIGIKSLGWRFYIIWTIFNFCFVPIIYFFYPETANRSLEDIDRFFIENDRLLVNGNASATSAKRPVRYIELEQDMMTRNLSISQGKADTVHMESVDGSKAAV